MRTPSSRKRSRRASRPSHSNGTSNRLGPSPPAAITRPQNGSSGGCPFGRSISVGNGSWPGAWKRRSPGSGTRWNGAGTSETRRPCSRRHARRSPSEITAKSDPSPPRRSRRRTPNGSTPGPRRSWTGPPRRPTHPGGAAAISPRRRRSSPKRGGAAGNLRLDADEIRKLGAEATNFEGMLVELGKAIEGNDLLTARRLVSQARHTAEATRETHFRTIMERSLQIILANATRGLDPVVARQLLREVDDAITLGKAVDMQALIDQRMEDQDAQTEGKLNERVLRARDDIVALRQAGQTDTAALEGKLADAAIAMQEGRYLHSDALLDSIEHDISATRESLRSTAAEILGQARGEVARAKADGIPVDAAGEMPQDAEAP